MPDLKFPVSSTPGRLPQESGGILMNAFAEKRGDTVSWRRTPGSVAYGVPNGFASGSRGMMDNKGTIVNVSGPYVWAQTATGIAFLGGPLPNGRLVTIARNNLNPTPDVAIALEEGGVFLVVPNVGVIPWPATQRNPIDPAVPANGLPANANSVSTMDGLFLFTVADGRMFSSNLNTTDVPALNFATAENRSDGLLRGIVSGGIFYAMGPATIEPWLNVGKEFFPLTRGTSVLQVGLLTAGAVAGHEEGWAGKPYFVTSEHTVHELDGYQTRPVSTPPVEEFLRASPVASLEASVYAHGGHAIWEISSDIGTWCYNVTTKAWHQRQMPGGARARNQRSVRSGDRWITGDVFTSSLLAIDETLIDEAGAIPAWRVESAPLKSYPMRGSIPTVFADFTLARGHGSVLVSWSHDGGVTWRGPYSRSIAPVRGPVRVNRLGVFSHHGLLVRVECTENVDFAFLGATVADADARRP
jgi:hypothetical protein